MKGHWRWGGERGKGWRRRRSVITSLPPAFVSSQLLYYVRRYIVPLHIFLPFYTPSSSRSFPSSSYFPCFCTTRKLCRRCLSGFFPFLVDVYVDMSWGWCGGSIRCTLYFVLVYSPVVQCKNGPSLLSPLPTPLLFIPGEPNNTCRETQPCRDPDMRKTASEVMTRTEMYSPTIMKDLA